MQVSIGILADDIRICMIVRVLLTGVIFLISFTSVEADRIDAGFPCELYVGVYRSIEIGNHVSYAIDLLEDNNYRCKEFKGSPEEIVTCDLKLDVEFRSEISLIVENGKVADIENRSGGIGCLWDADE